MRHRFVLPIAGVLILACGRVGIDNRDEHGMTALMRAARAGDTAEAQRLIERGADVRATVPRRDLRELIAFLSWMQQLPESDIGFTALHYAAKSQHVGIASMLMTKGADPLADDGRAELSPLDLAIFNRDSAMVEQLTSKGAKARPGEMWLAVANGTPAIVKLLIERGGDLLGTPPPFGGNRPRPPLAIVAATRGEPEILRMLLAAGADPRALDENGWTAVRHAKELAGSSRPPPRLQEVIALLETGGGADVAGDRASALFDAVQARNPQAVDSAIKAGANVNARNQMGIAPLTLAARKGDSAIVALLLTAGAGADINPQYQSTPLINAVESGNAAVVRMILAAGASPNQVDRLRRSPLRAASDRGTAEITTILLEAGATPDPRALTSAAIQGRADQVRLLLARGLDANADSGHALSEALRGCARRNTTEAVRLLLGAGANPNFYREMPHLHRAAFLCPAEVVRLLLDRGARRDARDEHGKTALDYAAKRPEIVAELRR